MFGLSVSGCNRYEYHPFADEPSEPEPVLQVAPAGEISSSQLGEVLWRFGKAHQDPWAMVTAVGILARSPLAADNKQALIKRLDEAVGIAPDDILLERLADQIERTFDQDPEVQQNWPCQNTFLNVNDRNANRELAEIVWLDGESRNDPVAMVTSVMVLANVPAGAGGPELDSLDQRLVRAIQGLPPDALASQLALRAKTTIDGLRGQSTRDLRSDYDWPTFLGPKRNGKSSEKGIISPWPQAGPRLVWQTTVGLGYGMCSIKGNQLFQFDRHGDQIRLSCLDAETGKPFEGWSQPFEYTTDYVDLRGYNGGPRCSPVVHEFRDPDVDQALRYVYIYGPAGKLHCVDATNGELIWPSHPGTLDLSKDYNVVQNQFGVGSTPLVVGDNLIVVVGGSDPEYQDYPPDRLDEVTGNGSAIVALDKKTGKVRYVIGNDLASYASPQQSIINGEQWCFALLRGGLLGFDPEQGKIRFEHPWRSPDPLSVNASTPVVYGDAEAEAAKPAADETEVDGTEPKSNQVPQVRGVFVSTASSQGSLLLEGQPDGSLTPAGSYDRAGLSMQFSTPILHEGYLYGSSGQSTRDAELRCIDWNTGALKWNAEGFGRLSLLYVDQHFVGLTEYGQLILFKADPQQFQLVSQVTLSDEPSGSLPPGFRRPNLLKYPCWTSPALANGRLYLRGPDRLVCLELIPQPDPATVRIK